MSTLTSMFGGNWRTQGFAQYSNLSRNLQLIAELPHTVGANCQRFFLSQVIDFKW